MAVLVGKKAPDFTAKAVVDGGQVVDSYSLSELEGKYVLLFFYPLDSTFVCPTELHAFGITKRYPPALSSMWSRELRSTLQSRVISCLSTIRV